jgi:SurA N-terminal domain
MTERSLALPAPEDLVPNTIALVSDVPPAQGRVTKAEFRHALELAAAAQDRRSVPGPREKGYEGFARATLDSLLEAVWLKGEAAEVGIAAITRRQVMRELAAIKRESFKSEAEYRRFLKEARYTKRDVYERVELQLLSVRMQRWLEKRVLRDTRNEFEEQRAIEEYLADFEEKWRARTVCAPRIATERCSNGSPPVDHD